MKKIVFMILIILPINTFGLNKSMIVMERDSKRILYQNNIYQQRLIASTTKIMTAILAIESDKLMDIVPVGEEVLKMYGSNIYISYKENMLLMDLIYGLMLRSGNDAAVVIANYIGDSEQKFVQMMNDKAKEIGMKDTFFNNPHGLDEETENKSTAYDMALLTSYASSNKTYLKIASTKYYYVSTDVKDYAWKNRNDLLFSCEYLTSGKTGYTPRAGKILATSASKNDLNLVIVGFDNGYNYEEQKVLYEEMFNKYKNYKILDKNTFKIKYNNKFLHITNSFYYPLTEQEKDKVVTKVMINEKVVNKRIGYVYVYLDDALLHKEEILIENNDNWIDKIKKIFKKIF